MTVSMVMTVWNIKTTHRRNLVGTVTRHNYRSRYHKSSYIFLAITGLKNIQHSIPLSPAPNEQHYREPSAPPPETLLNCSIHHFLWPPLPLFAFLNIFHSLAQAVGDYPDIDAWTWDSVHACICRLGIPLSQLTQALGEEFPPAVGVVHLGTPGSTFHLKVVQIYGPCRWIHLLAGGFLTEGPRENGRLVHAS